MSQGIVVQVFGRTDVGKTRDHNEDSFVVAELTSGNATLQPEVRTHVPGERGTLFMVADGMGGAAAGEVASAMAIDVVLEELNARWRASEATDSDTFAAAIRAATEQANARINKFAAEHPEHRGMGTTATIAGLLGDALYVSQVGDSRAYLVRDGVAQQITKDQSLMQKLIEAGEITAEEAEKNDRRNIILQALGPEANIRVDLTYQPIRRGDVLVLCSDGLSGQVKTSDIAKIATEEKDLVNVCRRLIDMANDAGGPDNITVIAARFEGDGLAEALTEDAVGHRVFRSSAERKEMFATTDPTIQHAGHAARATMPVASGEAGEPGEAGEDEDEGYAEEGEVETEPVDTDARRRRARGIKIALVIIALAIGAYYLLTHFPLSK